MSFLALFSIPPSEISTCDSDPEEGGGSVHHVHPRAVVVPAVVGGVAGEELSVHGVGGRERKFLPVVAVVRIARGFGSKGGVGHSNIIIKANCFFF